MGTIVSKRGQKPQAEPVPDPQEDQHLIYIEIHGALTPEEKQEIGRIFGEIRKSLDNIHRGEN